jgi:diadenosine tetraphosphate (Ap4A) HIT family hydrolase
MEKRSPLHSMGNLSVGSAHQSFPQQQIVFGRPQPGLVFLRGRCLVCGMNGKSCYSKLLSGRPKEVWDHVLCESDDFVCVPTLGSIVPGWVLVVPRKEILSFGQMEPRLLRTGEAFAANVAATLEDKFGRVVWFEHGPARVGSPVGCTVDHAHLHLVPTHIDLLAGAQSILGNLVEWREVKSLADASQISANGLDYLFLRQSGKTWIGTGSSLGSQVFRRVIAVGSGVPDQFNWRQHSFEENVRITLDTLGTSGHRAAA